MASETGADAGGFIRDVEPTESRERSIPTINPDEVDAAADAARADATSGKPRRKRRTKAELERDGYKPANQSRPAAAKTVRHLDVNSVQFALTGIHAALASMAAAPEWRLDADESKTMADAVVAVSRHFDLQASAYAIDLGNFAVTFSIIYGGKIARTVARKRAEREANPQRSTAPVKVNTPPSVAVSSGQYTPKTTVVHHPVAAGKPNGAAPVVRPRTQEDLAMLEEVETYAAAI
jgi:hypothetical protein